MTKKNAFKALAVPDFRAYFGMYLASTLAIQIQSIAVSWYVYDITGDPLMLGLVGLVEAIPAILFSLYAGYLADKLNRWSIILTCLFILLLGALGLVYLAAYQADFSQKQILVGIFGVVALLGLMRGTFGPARFSILPSLVPKDVLPNAITWNSSAWQVASVSGLGLGGIIYGTFGITTTFWVVAALALVSIFAHLLIKIRPTAVHAVEESALVRILSGLRFVRKSPILLSTMILDMLAVLFGGAVALLPIFVAEILHGGPSDLGYLRASVSLGAILMTFVLAYIQPGRNTGRILLATIAGFGLCIIGFGLSKTFWLAFFFLFLSGVLDEVSVFIRSAIAQYLTPDAMKGRVSSINRIFITSSNEIGSFESGLTAKFMGTIPAILFGGTMCIVIVGVTAYLVPRLRNLDFAELQASLEEME